MFNKINLLKRLKKYQLINNNFQMGFLNVFKKNKKKDSEPAVQLPPLYQKINKFSDYLAYFIKMQHQGNYAPISAYEDNTGKITGFLFLNTDNSYSLMADEVVKIMESRFEKKLNSNQITSYTIFYHSQFNFDDNHTLAQNDEELKAITIAYNFGNKQIGKIGLPYIFENDEITYSSFKEFNQDENSKLLNSELKEGIEYFEDREEINAPETINKFGIKIKKSNTFDLVNTWCGIFGFNNYHSKNRSQILKDYFSLILKEEPCFENNIIRICQMQFDDVDFKTISINDTPRIILPKVKTEYTIDVENAEIQEWENLGNQLAIVKAKGKDTFAIRYLATDYGENKEKYFSQKHHKILVSGIAFVLDTYKQSSENKDINMSNDFTAYMPNDKLSGYACFDFIGELEDYKETFLLNANSLQGYLLKIRLITKPDIHDFFTIQMFVHPENMRFSKLEKGMKLTGMFQLQGRIAAV
jgi:hypothetical protein